MIILANKFYIKKIFSCLSMIYYILRKTSTGNISLKNTTTKRHIESANLIYIALSLVNHIPFRGVKGADSILTKQAANGPSGNCGRSNPMVQKRISHLMIRMTFFRTFIFALPQFSSPLSFKEAYSLSF